MSTNLELAFDIFPIHTENDDNRKKRDLSLENREFDSSKNHHGLFKRSLKYSTKAFSEQGTVNSDLLDFIVLKGSYLF